MGLDYPGAAGAREEVRRADGLVRNGLNGACCGIISRIPGLSPPSRRNSFKLQWHGPLVVAHQYPILTGGTTQDRLVVQMV